ncbi:glucose-6-phosphate isomerase [Pigmentiphaga soli]|uniref:Glucose-6-phosphate isomerase n=1 Tax=Pigmentiphaga soli TaxID=1007095 RepID=A0ABP8H354_9BURK
MKESVGVSGPVASPAPLAECPEWRAFLQAAKAADRGAQVLRVVEAAGLHLDLSAQAWSEDLRQAGEALLAARGFDDARRTLLEGGIANVTEHRAAWHTALRAEPSPVPEVGVERDRVRAFVRRVDGDGRYKSVLHIGIGGSDWGPKLVVSALGYAGARREVRFVANIDGHAMEAGVLGLDPHATLVVVSSKSFSTIETMRNAERAIEWLRDGGVAEPMAQVAAVTSNVAAAQKLGVPAEQIFRFWDWAGGRYSVWSSIGLPIALALGAEALDGLLEGAAAMDAHFARAPLSGNAPVQLALAGLANRSAFGYATYNIAPYDARLGNLVPYLQQLEMESLGKSVDVGGATVTVPTGPVVWGMPGTDGQHTFFQWLHQGPEGAPVDFIICREADHPYPEHHRLLVANCLAQREALLRGKSVAELVPEQRTKAANDDEARWLACHKAHHGGRPSNLIVLPRLAPQALGALLALYEHKVFVQGAVWGIDVYDQWGVEYGKVLATGIAAELGGGPAGEHDVSTAYWVGRWK